VNSFCCCLLLAAAPAVTTTNFEVRGKSARVSGAEVAELCEAWRDKLQTYWLQQPPAAWTPKCVVILHPTRASYLAAVGRGGEQSRGSSWIEFKQGQVSRRQIDLLGEGDLGLTALAHEMTHVIFADLFGGKQPPRWADEGAAMLADSLDKQRLHQRDLEQAMVRRQHFRMDELFAIEHYPASQRVPGFYGQSVSVAAFLARRDDPAKFVKFVELALSDGYEKALRETYGLAGTHALEAEWLAHRNGGRGYHDLRLTLDASLAQENASE
jgi:hypothetical protein